MDIRIIGSHQFECMYCYNICDLNYKHKGICLGCDKRGKNFDKCISCFVNYDCCPNYSNNCTEAERNGELRYIYFLPNQTELVSVNSNGDKICHKGCWSSDTYKKLILLDIYHNEDSGFSMNWKFCKRCYNSFNH
jgi:hypothetical protein